VIVVDTSVIFAEVLQGLRSDEEAQLVEGHLRRGRAAVPANDGH
jgi:hypothetical protein